MASGPGLDSRLSVCQREDMKIKKLTFHSPSLGGATRIDSCASFF